MVSCTWKSVEIHPRRSPHRASGSGRSRSPAPISQAVSRAGQVQLRSCSARAISASYASASKRYARGVGGSPGRHAGPPPAVPDDVRALAPHGDVQGAAAVFGAARLREAHLLRFGPGPQRSAGEERLRRPARSPAEDRRDERTPVHEEPGLDDVRIAGVGDGDLDPQPGLRRGRHEHGRAELPCRTADPVGTPAPFPVGRAAGLPDDGQERGRDGPAAAGRPGKDGGGR
ncbi:hypothetical protein [Streptomyces viridochromogenes]|uniref:hypothetical protein n=1 Tax=Streptomyces viridochromogenes TaxID=1938 RepID=UPI00068C9497|nr:hypothetical protein [Streptomyces viridochromogenes]